MLSFKQILVSLLAILVIAIFSTVTSKAVEPSIQSNSHTSQKHSLNKLESNQDYIYYMYSNENGHYFLQPSQEFENVIYIGLNDYKIDSKFTIDINKLHHGQKFIGTFADESVWELLEIEQLN